MKRSGVWWGLAAALGAAAVSRPAISHAVQSGDRVTQAAASASSGAQAHALTVPGKQVLFSGQPEEVRDNWVRRNSQQPAAWKIQDGAMVVGGGDIATRQQYGDFFLHLQFKVPYMPNAHGQERGNSGVGLQGRYEIQVLDSYGIPDPGTGDCGAVYSEAAPLFNACRPPLEWQTYDITFRAPRFDAAGKVTEHPRVTVLQNGMVVQNNQEIRGPTGIQSGEERGMAPTGPIVLQNHGTPVQYRDVWIAPLPPHGALHY